MRTEWRQRDWNEWRANSEYSLFPCLPLFLSMWRQLSHFLFLPAVVRVMIRSKGCEKRGAKEPEAKRLPVCEGLRCIKRGGKNIVWSALQLREVQSVSIFRVDVESQCCACETLTSTRDWQVWKGKSEVNWKKSAALLLMRMMLIAYIPLSWWKNNAILVRVFAMCMCVRRMSPSRIQ